MGISLSIREAIAEQMPEKRVSARFSTFESAYREIQDAAFNRRMLTADYVGRAAAAFAVFDSAGEVMWDDLMEKEPPISDLVRGGYAKTRLRGTGHGEWAIRRLR